MLEDKLQRKTIRATEILSRLQPLLIAVSGGIDSRVLAEVAKREDIDFAGLFFSGPQVSPLERKFAYQVLADLGRPFYVLKAYALKQDVLAAEKSRRCYLCKRYLFKGAWQVALRHGYHFVAEGSNASDRSAHRPGKKALQELGVASPLDWAGFEKEEIRQLARYLGIAFPEQPARPCLLTRFAYGYLADFSELYSLGKAEDSLAELGFTDFRLRVLDKQQLLLQLGAAEEPIWSSRAEEVYAKLEKLGFKVSEVTFSRELSGFFDRPNK